MIEKRQFRPNISPALALEYEAVLKRITADVGITAGDVDDFIEYLCARSNLAQIYFRWRPALRDPDDDRILELAFRTQAVIVTLNRRDFAGADQLGVRIMTPKDLLVAIGE